MSTTEASNIADAGQAGWTRGLARDLFPGPATPFAWTLLAPAAEKALPNVYSEVGGQTSASAAFWRLERGYAYLNAAALAEADQTLCGAAWLGPVQPPVPGGLRGRLQAGGVTKRCQARLASAVGEASGLQTRLSRWLAWVQGVKWSQADLLQVMEELEPHAFSALQVHFYARMGLNVARAALEAQLPEWLPAAPDVAAALSIGVPGLPSVAIAEAVLDAARREPADPERLATLARSGHRGPGEIRPDAARWADAAELLGRLAEHGTPVWTQAAAGGRREAALTELKRRLNGGQFRQAEELLAGLAGAMRAADVAWDCLALVMAAAQRWAGAAAREALAAGLIVRPADVLYLELEELKQVATGEWHAGDREEVGAAVSRRMAEAVVAPAPPGTLAATLVTPGPCAGPLYRASPSDVLPPAGARWSAETADAGCAPFWNFAACVETTGDDAWSPGMVVARGLGVPARVGVTPADA